LVCFAVAYEGKTVFSEDLRVLMMAGAALALLWIPVAAQYKLGLRDPYSPIALQALGYTFLFVVSGAYLTLRPEANLVANYFGYANYFDKALAVMLIGWAATVSGMYASMAKRMGASWRTVSWQGASPTTMVSVSLVLLAIGWGAQLTLLFEGVYFHSFGSEFRWSTENSVVEQVRMLRYIGFAMLAYGGLSNQKKINAATWTFLIAVVVVELIFSVGSGKRIDAMMFLFICSCIYVDIWRPRITWRKSVLIVSLAIVAFLFLGVQDVYRNSLLRTAMKQGGTVQLEDMWTSFAGSFDESLSDEGLLRTADISMSRTGEIVSLAALVSPTGEDDELQYGSTFLPSLVNSVFVLVPRTLLPVKPDVNSPYNVFDKKYFPGYGGSLPITYVGEAYYNFGLLGVVGVMFVFGVAQGAFYNYCRRRSRYNLGLRVAYVMVAINFAWVSSNMAPQITYVLRILVYVWLIGIVLSWRGPGKLEIDSKPKMYL
jgi:hypothetical protein